MCDRWLAHDKDDKKTERELLAEGIEDDDKGVLHDFAKINMPSIVYL